MVFCFRDGHRLLMGKYIYSQNSPSTPAPPGPERGSMTRSNMHFQLPFATRLCPTHLRPLPDTAPPSKTIAILQTVRTTGFPPSPPLINGGEGRGEVVLIYSASVAVSGCDLRRLYFKKSRQIRPNQTRSSHPGPRPSPAVAITKPANRSTKSKRWNRFPLSQGERAGVRASVEPYLDQLPISTANPAKSNQIKPSRNAPTPLISANHPVRLSITPFSGSIRPKTAVNRTNSNQFKPGLLTLLTRVSQTCPINTQSPTPRNSSLVNHTITLK